MNAALKPLFLLSYLQKYKNFMVFEKKVAEKFGGLK